MLKKLGIIIIVLLIINGFCNAQITKLDYYMEYDTSTCKYDFYIVIVSGSNATLSQSFLINSQYSIVVPYNSTKVITQNHNPLQYPSGQPCIWNIGTTHSYPLNSPEIDFISITPSLNPLSKFDPMMPNDTVKLFSMDIVPPNSADNTAIRLYRNNSDPGVNDPDMLGQSFTNSFTIGSGSSNQYDKNKSPTRASNTLTSVIDTSNNSLFIDITTDASICQLPLTYQWYGPNNYSSNTEDVALSPYTPANRGIYTVITTDNLGNLDTTALEIGSNKMHYALHQGLQITINRTSVGVLLPLLGDQNKNSELIIEYRKNGLPTFQQGITTTKANPGFIVDGNPLGLNYHAGSLFSLGPNTKYDLRVSLVDPEGFGEVINASFTTPSLDETTNPTVFYVAPGTSGGSGSANDPFRGMQTALNNTYIATKTLLAYDGTYEAFTINHSGSQESSTTIKSINLHGAIIDGNNTSTGIVTLGNSANTTHHIIIDGFVIQNGNWGVDAQNTQDLIIRNNKIIDVEYGFVNRKDNGWESNQYIYNNLFEGRTVWPQTDGNIPSERGIDLRGNKNVVHNNTISNFGDGISTDGPPYGFSHNMEIHHNDITRIVDDLIEIDGSVSNSLIYRNRLMNGRAGVSLAPILGGPAYIFRNEIINTEYSAFKLNRAPTGIQIYHNTVLNAGYGMSSPTGWQSTIFKNNTFFTSGYVFEEDENIATGLYKFDYNAYKSTRSGTAAQPWFKWDNVKYNVLNDLTSGTTLDSNSIVVDLSDFNNINIPAAFSTEVLTTDNNIMPTAMSLAKDAGQVLNNLNDPFVKDGNPDIGAYEYGQPIPVYGHNFGEACSYSDLSIMTWNGSKNDSWFEELNWTPCGVPNTNSVVTIPSNMPNMPFLNTMITIRDLNVLIGGGMLNLGNIIVTH